MANMKKIIIILFFFTAVYTQAQVKQEWVRTYGYGGSSGLFVNTDLSGNAYVVGYLTQMDAPIITYLQAFNSSGAVLWDSTIWNTPCRPIGVNLDSSYNQYIAGYYPGGWGPANISIFKFSPFGIRLWSVIEPITFNDKMNAMTGDKAGNSFIVKFENSQRILEKYNSSGIRQFSVNIIDTIDTQSITLDSQGNIIICGFLFTGTSNVCVTIKFNSAGIRLWRRIFIPDGNGLGSTEMRISASSYGNIYVLCTTRDIAYFYRYTLLKYNSQGTQQWVSYYNVKDQGSNATAICVDNNDVENIVITGLKGTVKYTSSGLPIWFDTTTGFRDIKPDSYGNYYLTGYVINNSYYDIRTIKLNPNGIKLWEIRYNGTYNYGDGGNALSIGSSGNIFVTGFTNQMPMFGSPFGITIKYSQFEIDTAYSNFLPLTIGNVWVYKHYTNTPPSSNFEYRGKERYEIKRDTLMTNGKRYYDRTYIGLTRIDPNYLTVFQYTSPVEVKRDSLRARLFDTVVTCYRVSDTTYKTVIGQLRRNKFVNTYCMITNHTFYWNLTYGLGYWTYTMSTDGTIVGFCDSLVGAVINGVVIGDTTMTAIQKLSNNVPDNFYLYQNYPNPFNPVTKIKFDIPATPLSSGEGMGVRLIIYDVLGREVTTLVNEQLRPGTYEVEFDGTNYPSGVYFYKLIAGNFEETKKMIFIK
jgi:hypothetical protein